MEGICALAGLRCAAVGGLLERGTQIHRHRVQPSGSGLTQLVIELLEGARLLAFAGPDHRAGTVVVGDHGQVAVALAVTHLVHPDPVDLIEAGVVELVGHHPFQNGDRLPGAAQQSGERGLVHPLRQPGHDVFEVAGEPRPRPGPGHLLGDHPCAASTHQPADLAAQEHLARAQVQAPPAPPRAVVDRPGRPATRAAQPLRAAGQVDHDPLRREGHGGDVGTGDREHLVECSCGAHMSAPVAGFVCFAALNLGSRHVRVTRPPPTGPKTPPHRPNQERSSSAGPTGSRGVPYL